MTTIIRSIALVALLALGATSLIASPPYDTFYRFYDQNWVQCGYRYELCTSTLSGGCQWTENYTVDYGEEC